MYTQNPFFKSILVEVFWSLFCFAQEKLLKKILKFLKLKSLRKSARIAALTHLPALQTDL